MLYSIGFILLYIFIGLNVGRFMYLYTDRGDISIVFLVLVTWPLVVLMLATVLLVKVMAFVFSSHFLTKYLCFYGDWFYKRFGNKL